MELNCLPADLLCEILIRIPAKSLLQIRCVCKYWYSLINSSNFISLHLNHTHVSQNPKILFRRMLMFEFKETYTLHHDNQHFNSIESLYFPFKSKSEFFVILGCVNGLVCLWDYKSGIVLLWNPSIRKCYILPDSSGSKYPPGRVFGFGFDVLTNDYKVVSKIDDDHNYVFSLREKCWRKIDFVPNWNTRSRPRTVGGIIHRVTALDDHRMKLVSFDLSSESCSEFACPDEVNNLFPYSEVELSIFRDSLVLIHTLDYRKSDIWRLLENAGIKSWVKLFTLDLGTTSLRQFLVGFTKNGLVVMMGRPGAVVEPIVDNPVMVNLEISHREYHWHVESYQESLVLLQEGVDIALSPQNFADDKKGGIVDAPPVTIIID
ncbi:putative F-box protein At1g32420 [Silene latifolia]|uniref:putative F-box protein At1g32420 n=1 Tax=Silene latifolia TaxID=37657 RepID=UPI003D78666F